MTQDLDIDPRDLLATWGAIRRANNVNYNPDARLCHHTECPEYSHNYCNAYPVIPERFEDCGFPGRLSQIRERMQSTRKESDA